MEPWLAEPLESLVGATVERSRPVSGGDINQAYAVQLDDGRRLFVKANSRAPAGMFAREADGLAWLAAADALRIPRVIAVGDQLLVLEFIDSASSSADYAEAFGRGLAALHRAGAKLGGAEPNYIATLPQDNRATDDWPSFYRARRLEPMVRRAVDDGPGPRRWIGEFEALYRRLETLAGPPEEPARLHGDLWSGNVMVDERGAPCLVDPAVYGGHREIDLAMLRLFGSPGARFFAAYDEAYPLADGADDRVALYQLYPLLVHVNLFGGSYVASVDGALARYS